MTDHSQMKLGRKAIKTDARTLRLARYLTSALPAPPESVSYSKNVPTGAWGMLLNDQLGDCTIAGALHLDQALAAAAGKGFKPTDAEALAAYEAIDGYRPGDPSTDQGGVLIDVLKAWRSQGIGGRKILGFAAVNIRDRTEVQQAIYLFGGIYTGAMLPISAQTQPEWWDASPNDGGVWGGHCVPDLDYDKEGLACITWGAVKRMTWAFFQRYCDEAYAVISQDFIEANGSAPSGFDLAQLQADLALIR